MSDTGSRYGSTQGDTWRSNGTPPRRHVFDPYEQPDLFRGVLTRRVVAFLIDVVVISIPIILAVIFISIFGLVTFGLGWGLFWLISPATVIWPIVYYGMSLGGPHSATWGMRMMDLQLRTFSGTPGYFVLGCAHAVLLGLGVAADAAGADRRLAQRPPAVAARPRAGNRGGECVRGPGAGGVCRLNLTSIDETTGQIH